MAEMIAGSGDANFDEGGWRRTSSVVTLSHRLSVSNSVQLEDHLVSRTKRGMRALELRTPSPSRRQPPPSGRWRRRRRRCCSSSAETTSLSFAISVPYARRAAAELTLGAPRHTSGLSVGHGTTRAGDDDEPSYDGVGWHRDGGPTIPPMIHSRTRRRGKRPLPSRRVPCLTWPFAGDREREGERGRGWGWGRESERSRARGVVLVRTRDAPRRTTYSAYLCETASQLGIPSAERHRHRRGSATWRIRRIGAVPSTCRGRSPRHEESATEGGYFDENSSVRKRRGLSGGSKNGQGVGGTERLRARVEACRSRGCPLGTTLEGEGSTNTRWPHERSVRECVRALGGWVFVNYLVRTANAVRPSVRPAPGGCEPVSPVRRDRSRHHRPLVEPVDSPDLLRNPSHSFGSHWFLESPVFILSIAASRTGFDRAKSGGQLRRPSGQSDERCPRNPTPPRPCRPSRVPRIRAP